MSDQVVQSYHDGDGKAGQSVHSYQSVWMAHWTRTSCSVAPSVNDGVSLRCEKNSDHDAGKHPLLSGLQVASHSPAAKLFTEVTEARTVRIMNEGLTSSKNMVSERLECQPFPMFRLCQNISSGLAPKNDPDISLDGQTSRPQIDCNIEFNACTTVSNFPLPLTVAFPAKQTSLRECQSEGVSRPHEDLEHSHKVIGEGSLALTEPSQPRFIESTQILPYGYERGQSSASSSFTGRQECKQLNSVVASSQDRLSSMNVTALGHEHRNYDGPSAFSVCEKKLDNSIPMKAGTSVLRQCKTFQPLQDPFASNSHLGERCQKTQKCSVTGFFPSSSSPPEATKSESLYQGGYSLQKMPVSVNDMETKRICAANSVEGLAGGPGAFSQKTRNMLFMKQTDVNLSKENQTFSESKVSSKLKRNMYGELLSLSPPLGKNQQTFKRQLLDSTTQSEGKNNAEGVETSEVRLKNESSADTDIMDMDAFKERNCNSGVNSSSSNKDSFVGQNPLSQPIVISTGEEVARRMSITALPDINEEIPVLPAAGNSMDIAEPSTSKTQSLDAEHLLSHTEQRNQGKSTSYPDCPQGPEPGSRWLKRLRLSVSDSFLLGTKNSNLGEPSSHEKVNKLFSKVMEGSNSSSSGTMSRKRKCLDEIAEDQTAIVLQNGKSSSPESAKKGRAILLSHPWIQRWCHNRAQQKRKPEAVVVCEPQSTKMEFDELRNKQFPSTAAMALMGKAMSGFQQCEFQKRGSFVVWNTKGF